MFISCLFIEFGKQSRVSTICDWSTFKIFTNFRVCVKISEINNFDFAKTCHFQTKIRIFIVSNDCFIGWTFFSVYKFRVKLE